MWCLYKVLFVSTKLNTIFRTKFCVGQILSCALNALLQEWPNHSVRTHVEHTSRLPQWKMGRLCNLGADFHAQCLRVPQGHQLPTTSLLDKVPWCKRNCKHVRYCLLQMAVNSDKLKRYNAQHQECLSQPENWLLEYVIPVKIHSGH